MNYAIFIWIAVLAVLFAYLWRTGQLKRFAAYVQDTREELKKCTWPTWAELKGSTVVVLISLVLLGGFTVMVDAFCTVFLRWIT